MQSLWFPLSPSGTFLHHQAMHSYHPQFQGSLRALDRGDMISFHLHERVSFDSSSLVQVLHPGTQSEASQPRDM